MPTLRRLVEHPLVNLVVALVLVATSLAEGWGTLREDMLQANVGAHHGLLVFGFVNLLRTLPELMDAAEHARKAKLPG